MPLIRWEPWLKERELFPTHMARWMEELMGDGWPTITERFRKTLPEKGGFSTPRLDLFEEKDALIAKLDVPGIEKEQLTVTVEGDLLSVKGSFKTSDEVKEKDYYYYERATGGFIRTIPLPVKVNADKVSATLRHGLLEIRLPKAEETKSGGRKITIT
jgi:HSP20 family protein